MLSGFNTNVDHRGTVFHVQTEDSGRAHPHVITHLYYGGTILASEKQSYADHVDDPALEDSVRDLMEAQHMAMVTRLRSGKLDAEIGERLGDAFVGEPSEGDKETQPAAEPVDSKSAKTLPRAPSSPSGDGRLDEQVFDYLLERDLRSRAR